jgi:protein LSM14
VFRGSDIKDLQVFEAPPKPTPPPTNLPQDPAIMVISYTYINNNNNNNNNICIEHG